MILDQLLDFTLICSGFLEHFWIGSGHRAREKNPKLRFTELQEMALVCVRRTEMAAEVKRALVFGNSHCYIAVGVTWACMVHNMLPKITVCTNGPQRLRKLFQPLGHLLLASILNSKDALTW
jgi:hypothetical protein